jgi:hypothetical protein
LQSRAFLVLFRLVREEPRCDRRRSGRMDDGLVRLVFGHARASVFSMVGLSEAQPTCSVSLILSAAGSQARRAGPLCAARREHRRLSTVASAERTPRGAARPSASAAPQRAR